MNKIFNRLLEERKLLRSNLNVKNKQSMPSGVLLRVDESNRDTIRKNTISFLQNLGYEFKLNENGKYRGVGARDDFRCRVSSCYEGEDTKSTIVAFVVSIEHKEERNLSKEDKWLYYY